MHINVRLPLLVICSQYSCGVYTQTKVYRRVADMMKCMAGGSFTQGDVVGCLWDQRKEYVSFTINGQPVARVAGATAAAFSRDTSASEKIKGRFYPAVWVEADGARLSVNFG